MTLKRQFWSEAHPAINIVHGCALGAYIGIEMASGRFDDAKIVKLAGMLPVLSMMLIFLDRIGHRAAENKIPSAMINLIFSILLLACAYYIAVDIGASIYPLLSICLSWIGMTVFNAVVSRKVGER